MTAKRPKEKALLSKQDIVARRKALKERKLGTSNTGRRAIVGVFVLAASVLSFLSVATFDAHDRIGPGFRNAIGPVGHAIGEAFRGLLGVMALVVPIVGFYASGVLFIGERERKRWPQLVSFGLFLVSGAILAQLVFKEDASWAHAPGGLVGRELGGVMTALFSTVGTVVLVSAIAATAAIVGTQFAFLRFCGWAWDRSLVLADRAKAWALAFWAQQQQRLEERKLEAEKAQAEEAAFLDELEAEEAELAELEAAAAEAEAAADEAERLHRNEEEARARAIAEKEKLRIERERLAVEREAARLAKEALKSARLNEKERRAQSIAALTPGLLDEVKTAVPTPTDAAPAPLAGDPAWAVSFFPQQPPPPPPQSLPPTPAAPSQPPGVAATRRVPTIIEPPAIGAVPPPAPPVSIPPHPLEAALLANETKGVSLPPAPAVLESMGPAAAAQLAAVAAPAATGALAVGAQVSALAAAPPHALAKLPLIVEPKAPPKPTKVEKKQFEFSDGRTGFDLPPLDMLDMKKNEKKALDKEAFLATADKLTAKLRDFGIEGEVVEIRPGPVVTMYEFKPAPGVKISRIASLSDDLAMAMEAMRVRIVAPIPGKGVVGIEVPNKEREMVFLKEIGEQDAFQKSQSRLTMCLGKDIEGMPYILDLVKAPHLLIAGTTGSGKSVSVNAMIMSILLKSTPEEVRFIMVDPKMLELSIYEGIPHLLLPVVTDPRKASVALQWAVDEMTRRYKLLAEAGVRNISGYNQLIEADAKKKAAAKATVEAKATVLKPKDLKAEPKPAEAKAAEPVEVKAEEAAVAPPVVAPVEPAPKKKKRKLLIVDVAAEGQETPSQENVVPADLAPTPTPVVDLGVAAPAAPAEEIREAIAGATLEQAVEAAKTEAEIRVEEPAVGEDAPSEQEAAALAEAAAEPSPEPPAAEERQKLPYIVVIIDELADLMMVASKEVETSIARLAQMARAAGIHLMVATQRPSTDVVTGVIKANFPTRISFMLRSKPDSMTIIGTVGAEALLGMGDMLIMPPTSAHLQRVHGCFVSETEIKKVVDHLKAQGKPVYDESILKPREEENEGGDDGEDELSDELYDQAIAIVSEMKNVSISMLQRKMRIGYNRAARMIERMERDGVVGPADGAKPREVLVRGVGQMPGAGAPM
ncbi:MAG: DNA translocase FtsK 4TM domain-containing protein [Myxococcaceae bacterium]|nr:DNA translocase FtsK 4TM domain-containing protein [Myxococcaceae bacterium]